MKKVRATYGLTACLISVGLVLVYIHVQIPRPPANGGMHRLLVKDSYRVIKSGQPAVNLFQNIYNVTDGGSISQWRPTAGRTDYLVANHHAPPSSPVFQEQKESQTVQPLSTVHIVSIVSYMRSGSTLTADILQHFPGMIYVFEPLHTVFLRTRQKKPLLFLDGVSKKLNESDLTPEFIKNEINKWFTCRYEELDVHSLTDNFHTQYSRTMRKLYECWNPKRRTLASIRQCLPVAKELCVNAQHRLFKFIRVPMNLMEDLFPYYPNMQIIHLIRDPRGSLTSQIKLSKYSWSEVDTASKEHCGRIEADLGGTVRLYKQFPTRAKILIYENIAEAPITVAKRLYSYVNLPAYNYIIKYIYKITQAGRQDGPVYGIIRSNSTKTAYSWRDNIDLHNSVTIDRNCRVVYDFLGYQSFSTIEEIRNHLLSTRTQPQLPMVI